MKQYITVKQLNELSEKGKDKLYTWGTTHPQGGQLWQQWNDTTLFLPLLLIGQMIEFLNERVGDDEIRIRLHYSSTEKSWLTDIDIFPNNTFESEDNKELCDALWEAVKQILEQ